MIERRVTLQLPNCAPTEAVATVVERSMAERAWRAAALWAALWGAMAVCIFIPLLHFVLVPTLLVLGPVLGLRRLGEAVTLVSVRGPCPRCLAPRSYQVSVRFRDGRAIHCDGCGNGMILRLDPGVAAAALK